MLAVRERQVFCPKFEEIRLKPCPSPPKKEELLEYIRRMEAEQKVSLGINHEGPKPNMLWLLAVLSTYLPWI